MSLAHPEQSYLDLLQQVLDRHEVKPDRTGTGTLYYPGAQMRFDLQRGFPLLTTKTVHVRSVIEELLWIVRGDTNNHSLAAKKVRIWNEWADPVTGDLGPIYGAQWRDHVGVRRRQIGEDGQAPVVHTDQLSEAVRLLKEDPHSRRIILDAWNVSELPDMALTPCHAWVQFMSVDGYLDLMITQRSADLLLGVPFNIASYSFLALMVAQVTGLKAREVIWSGGDTHLYLNHLEQARTQLARTPRSWPTVTLNPEITDIDGFSFEDFQIHGYDPHPPIKAPVSV